MSDKIRPSVGAFIVYLVPITLIYSGVVLLPMLLAFYYSFFNWMGGPNRTFAGLDNYQALLNDTVFWQAFGNNIYLIVFCLIGQVGTGFIIAMILNMRLAKFKMMHRMLCYFPATLSAIVIGFVWMIMYDYRLGLINALLNAVGLEQFRQPWLSNPNIAMTLVSLPIVWQFIGWCVIIFLAGFTSIETSVMEMAEIDGANGVQRMVYIALPLMKKIIFVVVMLCISGNMRVFDHIFAMTGGGPGTATTVMAMHAFNTSFRRHNMGYGNAMSVAILVLTVATIAVAHLLFKVLGREKGDG